MSVRASAPFHVLAKPAGPKCNLACSYCFYLEKERMFEGEDGSAAWKMSPELLERYIREYLQAQPGPEVAFAWQGGEPTLCGVEFFERVVALQRRYADGRIVSNALQTNGTLLDDRWGEFLRAHNFLVGISLDGPPAVHNLYRLHRRGAGSAAEVERGLKVLRKHGVEFNTLTCVHRGNARLGAEVYRHLTGLGSTFLQFIPIVERLGEGPVRCGGGERPELAGPPGEGDDDTPDAPVTEWSVGPKAYGRFLNAVFDVWLRRDVGRVYVMTFEQALAAWCGQPTGACVSSPECGRCVAIEHTGDVYACDHYVYPGYRLGRVGETPLAEMLDGPAQRAFGAAKRETLPAACRACPYLPACWGGCPKHRFLPVEQDHPHNYLCAGYQTFFEHAEPALAYMAGCLQRGQSPAAVMRWRG